ncbi:transmembrane protein, putative (macronuclear) [Tetrahymena thermophila SB210]|uniref:Transmembrane protein, putative n=1 Tax=Tetrahymena thermophila (strain SB210) TaxID=312017 RepID=W7X8N6_TETTS|nr:transmembrane protein, putative [Tetrahymena thermophila SB210]EWS75730.1 transmembrane protein, putative [Tetrahymena thermophila SB210]|eukprot:XP_012651652.1 transmembrane protein, putative [Tetrahymena thermophila SB210]
MKCNNLSKYLFFYKIQKNFYYQLRISLLHKLKAEICLFVNKILVIEYFQLIKAEFPQIQIFKYCLGSLNSDDQAGKKNLNIEVQSGETINLSFIQRFKNYISVRSIRIVIKKQNTIDEEIIQNKFEKYQNQIIIYNIIIIKYIYRIQTKLIIRLLMLHIIFYYKYLRFLKIIIYYFFHHLRGIFPQ